MRYFPRSWIQMLGANFANHAEHSFRVPIIAMYLAKCEGANIGKVAQMGLVHDLPESRTGDPHYLSRQYVERKTEQAMYDMFQGTALEGDVIVLLQEYEARKTLEAKIVKDADNLDVSLELKEQEVCGYVLQNVWKIDRDRVVAGKLYTTTAKRLWKAIQASNPHDWHLNARNRFNAGDWKK